MKTYFKINSIELIFLSILIILSFSKAQISNNLPTYQEIIIIKAVGDVILGSYTPTPILPQKQGMEFVESVGNLLKKTQI